MKRLTNQAGDTLVEVMIAAVILSMMLVGAYTLSARATRLNQSAYERTVASQLVREQAELLKYAEDNGGTLWSDILAMKGVDFYDCRTAPEPDSMPTTLRTGEFYLKYEGTITKHDSGDNKVTDDLFHTWVARKKPIIADESDFYIYTCWQGIGNIGNQLSATVVRMGDE